MKLELRNNDDAPICMIEFKTLDELPRTIMSLFSIIGIELQSFQMRASSGEVNWIRQNGDNTNEIVNEPMSSTHRKLRNGPKPSTDKQSTTLETKSISQTGNTEGQVSKETKTG